MYGLTQNPSNISERLGRWWLHHSIPSSSNASCLWGIWKKTCVFVFWNSVAYTLACEILIKNGKVKHVIFCIVLYAVTKVI